MNSKLVDLTDLGNEPAETARENERKRDFEEDPGILGLILMFIVFGLIVRPYEFVRSFLKKRRGHD